MTRFVDKTVFHAERYSLGVDVETGAHYLSIPVANRLVDYEEYYQLDEAEYARFTVDKAAAANFAEECRRREHDDLLILQPGSDRGTAL